MQEHIRRYRFAGIVLDANLLLLLVVGQFNRNLVGVAKRLKSFSIEDFDLLVDILGQFQRVLVTPHILTEVSNLLTAESPHVRDGVRNILRKQIDLLEERHTSARDLVALPAFGRLGLTDVAIQKETGQEHLALTVDLDLFTHLTSQGIQAVNFNHIRMGAWRLGRDPGRS